MATTQRPTRSPKPPTPADRLMKGFDSLTLDPSPRLRTARKQLLQHDPLREAWTVVRRSIAEAVRAVQTTTKPR
jgi:hypothetical protein